jgi:hypothetical protein
MKSDLIKFIEKELKKEGKELRTVYNDSRNGYRRIKLSRVTSLSDKLVSKLLKIDGISSVGFAERKKYCRSWGATFNCDHNLRDVILPEGYLDEEEMEGMLTEEQKDKLQDLVFNTILPAISEDLGIWDEKLGIEALKYLAEDILGNYIEDQEG